MAEPRSTMIDPPIEVLLDKVDSKFTLVTLAAKRGRQVNSYFSQLGEGLGAIVPPQVASIARKPLSIALEEIAAGKVVAVWPAEEQAVEDEVSADETSDRPRERGGELAHGKAAEAAAVSDAGSSPNRAGGAVDHGACLRRCHRGSRCERWDRRLQGGRGVPSPRRRRLPRRAGAHGERHALCRGGDVLRTRFRARSPGAVQRRCPDPSHRSWSACRPRSRRTGDGPRDRALTQLGSPRTCSWRHCWRPGRPFWSVPPCMRRCGSTPRCRRTWRRCAAVASMSSSPTKDAWPAATSVRAGFRRQT